MDGMLPRTKLKIHSLLGCIAWLIFTLTSTIAAHALAPMASPLPLDLLRPTPIISQSPVPQTSFEYPFWNIEHTGLTAENDKEPFDFEILNNGSYSLVNYQGRDDHVYVPEQHNGQPVSRIGSLAFFNNTYIETISLPNSITEIEIGAFMGCTALKNITLSENLVEIGEKAFFACESLESISLPFGLSSIEGETFSICTSLREVTLPSSLVSIGERAFSSCYSLNDLLLPEGLLSIGNEAFDFVFLRNLVLPSTLSFIGSDAFFPSFTSFLVYPNSCGELYAKQTGIPYNLLGENLDEKYSWLYMHDQTNSLFPQLIVKQIDEGHAYFALRDPKIVENYTVNTANDKAIECMWGIDFEDQVSGERLKVNLMHTNDDLINVSSLKPEEMLSSLYYYDNANIWDIVRLLPVQRYGQWIIWDVKIPSFVDHNPYREIDFSFNNVAEYEINIVVLDEKRSEQCAFKSEHVVIHQGV